MYVHHGGDSDVRAENFRQWQKRIRRNNERKERREGNERNGDGTGGGAGGGGGALPWCVSVVLTTYDLAIRDLSLLRRQSNGPDR